MKNILVVDDDRDIVDAIQFALEDAGYKVVTALNGDYVKNLFGVNVDCPDLIVLDVLLSGQDGRVICKELKANKKTSQIPVVMISAQPDTSISTKKAGADYFLAKPFDVDVLLETVGRYVNRN